MAFDETGLQDVLREKIDQMKSAITGSVEQTQRAVSRASDALPDTDELQTNAINAIRENPLGLFFGMAALGFIIGSLLPLTPVERDMSS
jgi:ElaB/YqjD/DUF883 family membrane-anchored ribosome-binding protein